jgi:ATP-binding cassette subfamily B protein
VINLLITAMGRDLMSLIGLLIVMVVQDPIMSIIGVLVAPPAFLILRKLIRRATSPGKAVRSSGQVILRSNAAGLTRNVFVNSLQEYK